MRPILLAALAGCISNAKALTLFDDDQDGAYTEYAAAYGGVAPWDCDDDDASVHPGATEVCGGGDENCDGSIDEAGADGEITWYHDVDGDDHGDANNAVTACVAPAGYVASSDDCDDNEAGAHPGATEACNGFDDDCDDAVDETGATGGTTWYRDADNDGHGDVALTETGCDAPMGYVASADDCDDASDKTAPGKPEICNDGADNNCNGKVDQCRLMGTIDLATQSAQTLFGKNANDHLGIAAATGDLNDDGIDDLVVAIEGPSTGDGGSVRVTYGNAGFNLGNAPQVNLNGGPTSARPMALCIAPLTGDGVDDLVVGWGRSSAGAHPDYAVYSGAALTGATTAGQGAHITSVSVDTRSVAVACGALKHASGDVLVDVGGTSGWFFGPIIGARSLTAPSASDPISGYQSLDLDDDGWDDLWQHSFASTETTVFYGPVSSLTTPDLTLQGTNDFAKYIDAGDVNDDGRPDLLATERNATGGNGAAHLWYGTSSRRTGTLTSASANRHITGTSTTTVLYWAAFAGDVDGDGTEDVIASPLGTATMPTIAWLVYGASLVAGDATAGSDVVFNVPAHALAGPSTAVSGDWNGDGQSDILWLSPSAQSNGEAGAAFLVFGQGI